MSDDIVSTKVCNKCGEEKEANNDNFQWRKDTNTWRNTCRICMNINRSKSNNTLNSEDRAEYFIRKRNTSMANIFNDSDIEILKNLITRNDEIIELLNNKIELEPVTKVKRIPKSLNIEVDIFEKIQKHSENKNISMSDIVNKLLRISLSNIE